MNKLTQILDSITDQQAVEIIDAIAKSLEPGIFLRDMATKIHEEIGIPISTAREIIENTVLLNAAKKWASTQSDKWYPDDSGEWKEYTGANESQIDTNSYDLWVEILLRCERADRRYKKCSFYSGDADWTISDDQEDMNDIVAYKAVK